MSHYGAIIVLLVLLVVDLMPETETERLCQNLNIAMIVTSTIASVGVIGLLLARTYVLAHDNIFYMVLLGFLVVGWLATGMAYAPFTACVEPPPIYWTIQALNAGALISIEVGVLFITLRHAWALYRGDRISRFPLHGFLVRECIYRFSFIVGWGAFLMIAVKLLRPSIAGVADPFEIAFSSMLISRFYLRLSSLVKGPLTMVPNLPNISEIPKTRRRHSLLDILGQIKTTVMEDFSLSEERMDCIADGDMPASTDVVEEEWQSEIIPKACREIECIV